MDADGDGYGESALSRLIGVGFFWWALIAITCILFVRLAWHTYAEIQATEEWNRRLREVKEMVLQLHLESRTEPEPLSVEVE